MSVSELKEKLRVAGLSQVGDKQTLIFRLKLFSTAQEFSMEYEGTNVCKLKAADLKKAASKYGVSPIGSNDEILTALVEYLKSKGKPTDQPVANASRTDESSDGINPVTVAKRVLQLAEDGDEEGILNIATTKDSRISKNSPVTSMRKAYLKLSLLIHPDKLGRQFEHATKAFQALVKAFEHLSSPDFVSAEEDEKTSRAKKKQQQDNVLSLARSNEGCFRTRICCPRCKQPWSEGSVDGNPDYCYNFMMTGLKQFTCSTCLCEFGCMTGLHRCPSCAKPFEYCPQDYHRKITCGNAKCSQLFGFYMYHVSERVVKELKKTIREEQELLIRNREAKLRRAQRSSSKRSDHLSAEEEEKAFTLGLIDCCPRCGESFEGYPEEDLQREHLVECMDDKKHALFQVQ